MSHTGARSGQDKVRWYSEDGKVDIRKTERLMTSELREIEVHLQSCAPTQMSRPAGTSQRGSVIGRQAELGGSFQP